MLVDAWCDIMGHSRVVPVPIPLDHMKVRGEALSCMDSSYTRKFEQRDMTFLWLLAMDIN